MIPSVKISAVNSTLMIDSIAGRTYVGNPSLLEIS